MFQFAENENHLSRSFEVEEILTSTFVAKLVATRTGDVVASCVKLDNDLFRS